MNLTLTITGTASQLALVLAALGGDQSAPSITIGGTPDRTPIAPTPAASALPGMTIPNIVAPPPADDEGAPNAAAPLMDASGLPWDERIHAGTKALTDDGMWRKRRGVAKSIIEAVEAQLRAAAPPMPVVAPLPVMPPPLAAAPPMPVVAPLPVMPPPLAAAPPMPVMPPPLAAPPMPVAPMPEPEPLPVAQPEPIAPAAAPLDFAQFMQHISGKMTAAAAAGTMADFTAYLGTMTAEIATAFGQSLGAITDIAGNPQMIVYASQLMQRDGRW